MCKQKSNRGSIERRNLILILIVMFVVTGILGIGLILKTFDIDKDNTVIYSEISSENDVNTNLSAIENEITEPSEMPEKVSLLINVLSSGISGLGIIIAMVGIVKIFMAFCDGYREDALKGVAWIVCGILMIPFKTLITELFIL